jgi:hypothetical protein
MGIKGAGDAEAMEDVPEDRQIIRFSRALAPSALGDGKQKYYEVPFDKAVDVIVANRRAGGRKAKKISKDYVFVGETPSALTDIGFVKMPVMMTQHHIETCYFTEQDGRKWKIDGHMHGLGDVLKKVPEALKKPVMVIASRSPTGKDTSVVAITSVPTPKGDMILPVVINGEPDMENGSITAHVMTSAHGRKNAWTGLVKAAIDTEDKGGIGIFFVDKAKASKVFTSLAQANPQLATAGLKYAKKPQGNGVLHSIHDPGSPVKAQAAKISSQTETLQFSRGGVRRKRAGTIVQRVPRSERRAFHGEFNKAMADYAHNNNGETPKTCGVFTREAYYVFDTLLSHRRDRILSLVGSYGIITAASPSMGNLTLFA